MDGGHLDNGEEKADLLDGGGEIFVFYGFCDVIAAAEGMAEFDLFGIV